MILAIHARRKVVARRVGVACTSDQRVTGVASNHNLIGVRRTRDRGRVVRGDTGCTSGAGGASTGVGVRT